MKGCPTYSTVHDCEIYTSLDSGKTPNGYFYFLLVITQVLDMGLVGHGDGMDPNGGKRKNRHTVRTQRRDG
jgi:hypothetical protein